MVKVGSWSLTYFWQNIIWRHLYCCPMELEKPMLRIYLLPAETDQQLWASYYRFFAEALLRSVKPASECSTSGRSTSCIMFRAEGGTVSISAKANSIGLQPVKLSWILVVNSTLESRLFVMSHTYLPYSLTERYRMHVYEEECSGM